MESWRNIPDGRSLKTLQFTMMCGSGLDPRPEKQKPKNPKYGIIGTIGNIWLWAVDSIIVLYGTVKWPDFDKSTTVM